MASRRGNRPLVFIASATAMLMVVGGVNALAAPGDKLWTRVIGGTYYASTEQLVIASTGRIYVTGTTDYRRDGEDRYTTVAYSTGGRQLWLRRYDSATSLDTATALALGPSERRLYVTGVSDDYGEDADSDWMTIAYRADGTRLWTRRYEGPAGRDDGASSVAVAATGRVFVTGYSQGKGTRADITTIAYEPDGKRLWTRRHDGGQKEWDSATTVLVGPSGHNVYVAGRARVGADNQDIAVLSYRANGSLTWRRQFDVGSLDTAAAAALGPSGRHLYVTGKGDGDYVTLAYRRDGTRLWARFHRGTGDGVDSATDVVVTPDGRTVLITGTTKGAVNSDVTTVAYSDFGDRLWTRVYDSGRSDIGGALAVSPNRDEFYLAASHNSISTVAYSLTGDLLWDRDVYWSNEGAEWRDIGVSPDGGSVVVTGPARDVYWNDALVIAYATQ